MVMLYARVVMVDGVYEATTRVAVPSRRSKSETAKQSSRANSLATAKFHLLCTNVC